MKEAWHPDDTGWRDATIVELRRRLAEAEEEIAELRNTVAALQTEEADDGDNQTD
jgi:hypothetical protein